MVATNDVPPMVRLAYMSPATSSISTSERWAGDHPRESGRLVSLRELPADPASIAVDTLPACGNQARGLVPPRRRGEPRARLVYPEPATTMRLPPCQTRAWEVPRTMANPSRKSIHPASSCRMPK